MEYPYTIKEADIYTKFILREMWDPCHDPVKKSNFVASFIGNMGDGKSLGILNYCWLVDVNPRTEEHYFNIDKFYFNFLELLNKVRKPDHVGEAFGFDEMELQAHARKSFSDKNLDMGDLFSIMRSRRQIFLYSLPSERQLDSQLRTLRKARFKFEGVSPEGYSTYIYHSLTPNVEFKENSSFQMTDTIKRVPELHFYDKSQKVLKYRLWLPKCQAFKKLVKQYEIKKENEMDAFIDSIVKRYESIPAEENSNKSLYDLINEVDQNVDNYKDPMTNKINPYYLQQRLGISMTKSNAIYREIKNRRKTDVNTFEDLNISELRSKQKKEKKRLQKLADTYNI
jgi:hypothetical protein